MNEYLYLVQKIELPVDDLLVIKLVPARGGKVFAFSPGQYVMIAIRNSVGVLEEKHAFSIASSPTNTGELELGIRIGGRFTRELAKAKPGAQVIVYGPYGTFSFKENLHRSAVFLAGGIGVTPFLSAIRYVNAKGLDNDLTLIYSNRTLAGTAFYDEINNLSVNHKNLKTFFSVTDDKSAPEIPGLIKERLSAVHLQNIVQSLAGKDFFLCGPPPFMAGMKKCLLEIGVPEDRILMEEFAMISNQPLFFKLKHFANVFGYSAAAVILPFYLIYLANAKPNEVIVPEVTVPVDTSSELDEAIEPVVENTQAGVYFQGSVSGETVVVKPSPIGTQKAAGAIVPKSQVANTPPAKKVITPSKAKAATTPVPTTASSIPANEVKPATTPATDKTTTPTPTTGASASAGTAANPTSGNTTTPALTTGASTTVTGGVASGGTSVGGRGDDDEGDDD